MLLKNRRISKKDFHLLLNNTKTFKNDLFFLRFRQINGLSRFSFTISKKVAKSAVLRNKMRRIGFRIIKEYIDLDLIKNHFLINLSYIKIPKDKNEVLKSIESILIQSDLKINKIK